jgi:hypothetical protein
VAVLSSAGLILLLVTATALAATGDISQPPGAAGCISNTGAGSCADGHGLGSGNWSMAVLPGGFHVYAATGSSVAHFNRVP